MIMTAKKWLYTDNSQLEKYRFEEITRYSVITNDSFSLFLTKQEDTPHDINIIIFCICKLFDIIFSNRRIQITVSKFYCEKKKKIEQCAFSPFPIT